MATVNDVIKFFNENKKFLPETYNEKLIKEVIEKGLMTADEVLRKLKNKVNKTKNFKEVEDEINTFNIETESKKLNRQLNKI